MRLIHVQLQYTTLYKCQITIDHTKRMEVDEGSENTLQSEVTIQENNSITEQNSSKLDVVVFFRLFFILFSSFVRALQMPL